MRDYGYRRILSAAMVLSGVAAGGVPAAQAQVTLPDLHISSRLSKGGITGASTTIISREDIERAPQLTIADILSREAGVQTSSFYGGVNGAGTTVDLRGFGVTGPSNTLVLINGRRLNDWDLPGFDLSTIAKESIERIEITRGNSGAVLYGDGAVGGVINIVTRSGADQPNQLRIEGGFGSFGMKESNVMASGSSGGFSAFLNGNAFQSDGWRDNNELRQKSGVADFRWASAEGSVYLNLAGDNQKLRLPGPRNVTIGLNQLVNDPRGTNTPFDYGDKQGTRATVGFTRMFGPGMELIVDAGIRQKAQQSGFFSLFSEAFVDTELTTKSLTPRLRIDQPLFGLPSRILAGVDVYDTDYQQNRSLFQLLPPIHRYTANQKSLAGYWQQTVSILPTTDISFGGRIQKNKTDVQDAYDPAAPQNFANPQGIPLNQSEVNHAYHLGAEHELFTGVTLFGRMAQSFRVPNIDERVGASPVLTITDFDLRTQKSHDYEGGIRFRFGPFDIQSSVYDMHLTDELHFNPVTGANVNLDPTRRTGVETIASWQVTPDVRLRGNLTYTNAKFVAGPFSGNEVPVVSPWTASAGLSWNIFGPQLVFDANLRYFSQRYLDGNEINANAVYFIPATTLVDLRIGGQLDAFFWSVAVQNVFDRHYYDYALDTSFPPFFPFYSFYPLPGRTFMAKAGMQF